MRPQDKQLRIVELLPGGEQITSRPLRVFAYMDDRGMVTVQKPEQGGAEDMLSLLSTLLAAAAAWLDTRRCGLSRSSRRRTHRTGDA